MKNKKLVLPNDRDTGRYILTNDLGEPLHYQDHFETMCDMTLLRYSLECALLHRENHKDGDLSAPLNLSFVNSFIWHLGYKLVSAK